MVMNIAQSPAPSSQPRRWVGPGVLAIFYQKEIWQNKRQDVFVKQEQGLNLFFSGTKILNIQNIFWICRGMSGRDMDSVNLVMNREFNEYLGQEGKINKTLSLHLPNSSSFFFVFELFMLFDIFGEFSSSRFSVSGLEDPW